MRLAPLFALALLAVPLAGAQVAPADEACPLGTAVGTLRGAKVEATLRTNGLLFYPTPGGRRGYLAPLGQTTPAGDPVTPLLGAGLWVGGLVGGEVRASASHYGPLPFRPGQTGPDGAPPSREACAQADRVWTVARDDVARYLAGEPATTDLAEWPVHLGAPVLDGDGVPDNYDLAAGDQPAIRGDVVSFWAMTDTASPRLEGEAPLGVDVTVEAFAVRSAAFATETLYRFTVTNRNTVPIEAARLGLFTDFLLGDTHDDYIGTDTTAQMVYTYNEWGSDALYGVPPAFGAVIVESPEATPNGRDGETDTPGEPLGLTASSSFFPVASGPTALPHTAPAAYHFLEGLWGDGSPVRELYEGYDIPEHVPTTRYVYPGDPVTQAYWSEVNSGERQDGGPRMGLASTGPVSLAPGGSVSVTYALVFGQGTDALDSIRQLRRTAYAVRQFAAHGGLDPRPVPPPAVAAPRLAVARPAPNPFRGTTEIAVEGVDQARLNVEVYDALGRLLSAQRVPEGASRIEIGAALEAGVYLVRVNGGGAAETFAITKLR